MTEEITRNICSRNKAPNMTIGNTEDAWTSIPFSSAGNGYIMIGDMKMPATIETTSLIQPDRTKTWHPIDTWKRLHSTKNVYSAIPDDMEIRSIPIHPGKNETYVQVEDVIALAQRFNEPEAALLVAAAQDFLEWVKTL